VAVPEKEAVGEEAPDAWVPVVSGKKRRKRKRRGESAGWGRPFCWADALFGPGRGPVAAFPIFFCSAFIFLFSVSCFQIFVLFEKFVKFI
jgi:hypothetical protein